MVRFPEVVFAVAIAKIATQSLLWHMGQAKRRRKQLGEKYDTKEGSNKPRPHESLKIYRSEWSGKWAVGIKDLNGELTCLDVFCNRQAAELDATAAKSVLCNYEWSDLSKAETWAIFIDEYSKASALMGVESDDEVIAVVSTDGVTPSQMNARFRELGLLSDNIWYRDIKK